MAVAVRIPTVFRKFTEQRATLEARPGTIGQIVDELDSRYPGFKDQLVAGDGGLRRFVNVYLNDEDVRYLDVLETEVADGDTVSLLPSVAGGTTRGRRDR